MEIPLSKPYVDEEMRDAVVRVLDSGRYILGPECEALEEELAAHVGAAHGVLVSSGTAAIHLTLLALGVQPGDEILVPSLTAYPTVEPIFHVGARPVFVDVDETCTVDPADALAKCTARTVGVVGVHLYGHPLDVDPFRDLCREKGLFFVEDACQAHGARYKGAPVGGLGDAACFSFYPSKNLTVPGDGGAVLTSDAAVAATVRRLRNHGRRDRYEHVDVGFNLRFNEIQAAVGRIQLRHLDEFVAGRRHAAAAYGEALADLPVQLPVEREWASHAFHLYVVRTHDRDRVRSELAGRGVGAEIHYPIPAHLQPATAKELGENGRRADVPRTEALVDEILSLPMHPRLTAEEVATVASALAEALERSRPR